jgi:protein SCO1/2
MSRFVGRPPVLSPIVALFSIALGVAAPVRGQAPGPEDLRRIGFDQHLGEQAPLDVPLRDEAGRLVQLAEYFGTKPVILTLNYYSCPMLCTVELNGLLSSLRTLSFDVGDQFEVVTLSIDPAETPALATAKKAGYVRRYGRPGAQSGWHFLTGDETSIRRLTRAVGFRYAYDRVSGQFVHPAGIVILTPRGRIARYLYGVEYPPRDLRLALIEASAQKIGSPVDQVLMLCFRYDPASGKYTLLIVNIMKVLGIITVAALGASLLVMFRRDRRRRMQAAGP